MPHKDQDDLDGFSYTASDESWIVDPHVLIYSTLNAIYSGYDRSILTNYGVLYGATALYFASTDATIKNKPGGLIKGITDGLFTGSSGEGLSIRNEGAWIGATNFGLNLWYQSTTKLTNTATGEIFGKAAGISNASQAAGGVFTNSGLIHSDQYGFDIKVASGLTTRITNQAGGVIEGDNAAIHVASGQIALTNHGKIVGDVRSPSPDGRDSVFNDGKIIGDISLGLGRDVVTFAGGSQGDVFGGGSRDTFVFKGKFAREKDAASIGDYTPGFDAIELSRKLFKDTGDLGALRAKYFHIGSEAGDGSDRIVYDSDTGDMFYDRDGTGSAKPVLFAHLSPNLDLQASDITIVA